MEPRRIAVMALLAGLWAAAWMMLPYLLYAPLDEPMRSLAQQNVRLLGTVLVRKMHLPDWLDLLAMVAIAFVAVASATALVLLIVRLLDRKSMSLKAALWGVRTLPNLAIWCLGWLLSIAVAALLLRLLGDRGDFAVLIPAAFLLSLPFFCLKPEIIAVDKPPRFWRPGWPGIAPVIFGMVIVAAWLLTNAALSVVEEFTEPTPTTTVVMVGLNVIFLLAGILANGWVLLAWQRHSQRSDLAKDGRDVLARQRLFPLVATYLFVTLLLSLLAIPIFMAMVNHVFILPQVSELFRSDGRELPAYLSLFGRISHWLAQYWWLPGLVVGFWVSNMSMARTLKLAGPLDQQQSPQWDSSAAIQPPPARE